MLMVPSLLVLMVPSLLNCVDGAIFACVEQPAEQQNLDTLNNKHVSDQITTFFLKWYAPRGFKYLGFHTVYDWGISP